MGMWIHVFCRSDEPLSCGEAMDFILEGPFFDHEPRLEQGLVSSDGAHPQSSTDAIDRTATEWGFDVVYGPEHRPIQISFGPANETTFAVIEEAIEEHRPSEPSPVWLALVARLRETRQELVLHFSSAVTDDAWEMLDSLEAFVARERDGTVCAAEGLYDANLERLWSFEDT
jgi:hypothetical protein